MITTGSIFFAQLPEVKPRFRKPAAGEEVASLLILHKIGDDGLKPAKNGSTLFSRKKDAVKSGAVDNPLHILLIQAHIGAIHIAGRKMQSRDAAWLRPDRFKTVYNLAVDKNTFMFAKGHVFFVDLKLYAALFYIKQFEVNVTVQRDDTAAFLHVVNVIKGGIHIFVKQCADIHHSVP